MRCLALPATLATVLIFAACGGGDDSSTSTTGASGASGAQGDTGMTASEFIAASIPDQLEAVQGIVDATPACAGVDDAAGGDFQVNVAIDAASSTPETPIDEIVADNCEKANG